jgi:hypothetical protein
MDLGRSEQPVFCFGSLIDALNVKIASSSALRRMAISKIHKHAFDNNGRRLLRELSRYGIACDWISLHGKPVHSTNAIDNDGAAQLLWVHELFNSERGFEWISN